MTRFIVVTGVPRSGTTAVGDVLSLSPGAKQLYEPLNYSSGLRTVSHYFELPVGSDLQLAREQIDRILRLRLNLKPGVFGSDSGLRRYAKYVIGGQTRSSYRKIKFGRRPEAVIWKDPFAAFLAPMLATDYSIPVVVCVRPPGAIAASFKRMGWRFDVAAIQQGLSQYEEPSRWTIDELDRLPSLSEPHVSAAVLWRLVYGTLLDQTADLHNVKWVDVDELVANPHRTYRSLFEWADLSFTARVDDQLNTDYSRTDNEPRANRAHDKHRNPAAVSTYWRKSLSDAEHELVNSVAGDLVQLVSRRCRGEGNIKK